MDQQHVSTIQHIIEGVLKSMEVEARVIPEDSITKGLVFNIETPDPYVLIGRQGSTLHALEILVHAIAAKNLRGTFVQFMIDVDDYKRKREWFLKETAKQAVERARRIGKPVALEPMPNFERRLVHSYLQEHFPNVVSDSVGVEPRRRIVVKIR